MAGSGTNAGPVGNICRGEGGCMLACCPFVTRQASCPVPSSQKALTRTPPGPTSAMRFTHVGALVAAVALVACGGSKSDTSNVSPTEPGGSTAMSATARAYLTEAVDFEQEVFLWGSKINWTTMRTDVFSKAANAKTTRDTYAAINYSIDHYFRPLGDNHSGFRPPESEPGRDDCPPNDSLFLVTAMMLTPQIAYLNVPTFSGTNPKGRADSTLAEIQRIDAQKPCGWIVDLRLNPGGTWAAMFAGMQPLLGSGAGQFAGLVDGDNNKAYFYVRNGEAGIYDPSTKKNYPQVTASSTYALSKP